MRHISTLPRELQGRHENSSCKRRHKFLAASVTKMKSFATPSQPRNPSDVRFFGTAHADTPLCRSHLTLSRSLSIGTPALCSIFRASSAGRPSARTFDFFRFGLGALLSIEISTLEFRATHIPSFLCSKNETAILKTIMSCLINVAHNCGIDQASFGADINLNQSGHSAQPISEESRFMPLIPRVNSVNCVTRTLMSITFLAVIPLSAIGLEGGTP